MKKIIYIIFVLTLSFNVHAQDKISVLGNLKYCDIVSIGEKSGSVSFIQKSDENPEGFLHQISSFRMGKYLITYELWYQVINWAIKNGYTFNNLGKEGDNAIAGDKPSEKGKYKPVLRISWRDIVVWCNAYSELSGFEPAYYKDVLLNIPIKSSIVEDIYKNKFDIRKGSIDLPYVKWYSNGYRFPTEGEIRYVATSGGITPINLASGADLPREQIKNDTSIDIDGNGKILNTLDVAWCVNNTYGAGIAVGNDGTQSVGLKEPNILGFCDISGNLIEFVYDWYGVEPKTPQIDYKGSETPSWKIIFGNSCGSNTRYLHIGQRLASKPSVPNTWNISFTGFRICQSNN